MKKREGACWVSKERRVALQELHTLGLISLTVDLGPHWGSIPPPLLSYHPSTKYLSLSKCKLYRKKVNFHGAP